MISIFSCNGPQKDVLKIELEDGSLSTPEKQYKLRLLADAKLKMLTNIEADQSISSLYVHGHDRRYEFAVFATPSASYQSIFYVAFPEDIESPNPIEIREASYIYNYEDKRLLLLDNGRNRSVAPGIISRRYRLTLPAELLAHQVREDGDGLQNPQRYKAQLENEHYRFIIDMLVDKEPYTLDMSFSYRIGTSPKKGVPGMP